MRRACSDQTLAPTGFGCCGSAVLSERRSMSHFDRNQVSQGWESDRNGVEKVCIAYRRGTITIQNTNDESAVFHNNPPPPPLLWRFKPCVLLGPFILFLIHPSKVSVDEKALSQCQGCWTATPTLGTRCQHSHTVNTFNAHLEWIFAHMLNSSLPPLSSNSAASALAQPQDALWWVTPGFGLWLKLCLLDTLVDHRGLVHILLTGNRSRFAQRGSAGRSLMKERKWALYVCVHMLGVLIVLTLSFLLCFQQCES